MYAYIEYIRPTQTFTGCKFTISPEVYKTLVRWFMEIKLHSINWDMYWLMHLISCMIELK